MTLPHSTLVCTVCVCVCCVVACVLEFSSSLTERRHQQVWRSMTSLRAIPTVATGAPAATMDSQPLLGGTPLLAWALLCSQASLSTWLLPPKLLLFSSFIQYTSLKVYYVCEREMVIILLCFICCKGRYITPPKPINNSKKRMYLMPLLLPAVAREGDSGFT